MRSIAGWVICLGIVAAYAWSLVYGDKISRDLVKIIAMTAALIYVISQRIGRPQRLVEKPVVKHRPLPKWVFPVVLLSIFSGVAVLGYYRLTTPPPVKADPAEKGTFTMWIMGDSCPGTVIMKDNYLTLQFRMPLIRVQFADIELKHEDMTIAKTSIEMICALDAEFHQVDCSADVNMLARHQNRFVDKGYFTVMYALKENFDWHGLDQTALIFHMKDETRFVQIVKDPN
jgi:hypothetical protein